MSKKPLWQLRLEELEEKCNIFAEHFKKKKAEELFPEVVHIQSLCLELIGFSSNISSKGNRVQVRLTLKELYQRIHLYFYQGSIKDKDGCVISVMIGLRILRKAMKDPRWGRI